jgi:hypothetical protein
MMNPNPNQKKDRFTQFFSGGRPFDFFDVAFDLRTST